MLMAQEPWTAVPDYMTSHRAEEVSMEAKFSNGYALLIGVNEHSVDRWALPDVAKDVAALREVLSHPDRCAYIEENVKVVHGAEATQAGIMKGLAWLQQRIKADGSGNTTALVYYSGHGWLDRSTDPPDAYLVPYDTEEGNVPFTALEATQFARAIDKLDAERLLVILDCCHAGAMGVKDAEATAPARFQEVAFEPVLFLGSTKATAAPGSRDLHALAVGSGRAVLSSSVGSQVSCMRSDRRMSIFTYHLIEALTGHAQPEGGATEVLVTDVMSYTTRHVPRSARVQGSEQTPDYRLSGNFPVALLLGGKGLTKGQEAPNPLDLAKEGTAMRKVDTGGGAHIRGDVNTGGGDFVGRDKFVGGDEVRGDRVGGDKITVGDISGSTGVAIGRGAQSHVTQGASAEALAKLFADVYQKIDARPEDPDVDKEELTETVQKIETEAAKGEQANPRKVERWLRFLVGMADDVAQVTAACLVHPAAGVAAVIRMVAQRAKEEGRGRLARLS
jgi:hypothetical protein